MHWIEIDCVVPAKSRKVLLGVIDVYGASHCAVGKLGGNNDSPTIDVIYENGSRGEVLTATHWCELIDPPVIGI